MNKNNDITKDRITNALKGDKEKYREGWEAIFGKTEEEANKELHEAMSNVYNHLLENSQPRDLGISNEEFWKLCEDNYLLSQERIDKLKKLSEGIERYLEQKREIPYDGHRYDDCEFVEIKDDYK